MKILNPVETRLRSENVLYTKLAGTIDEPMVKAVRESVLMYFGRTFPTDWVIDATGVNGIRSEIAPVFADLLRDLQGMNSRHIALIANNASVRMILGSASFSAGAKIAVVESINDALNEITRRNEEASA